MMKVKRPFLAKLIFLLPLVLPYIWMYSILNLDRKLYRVDFTGNEIVKINIKSNYQSASSFIINRNSKPFEFYYFFGNKELFVEKVKVGDRVCKASGTFNFIVTHKNGSRDTFLSSPPWHYQFFFMPESNLFKTNCP